MQRLRVWAWPASFAATMAGLCVVYFALPGPTARIVIGGLLTVLPGVAIVVGVWLYRPSKPLPWLLLAFSQVPSAAVNAFMVAQERLLDEPVSPPAVWDVVGFVTYLLPITTLTLFVRARARSKDLPSLLDALIVTVSVGALAWVFLIAPGVFQGHSSLFGRVIAAGTPLLDVLLLALLVRLLLDRGPRATAFWLLTAAIATMLGCDTLMALARMNGTWSTSSPIVDGYVVFGVLLGTSALLPSMRALTERGTPGPATITRARMATLLGLAALSTPAMIALQKLAGQPVDVGTVIVVALVLCGLAMTRMGTIVRALQQVMDQNEWWGQRETILREAAAALVAAPSEGKILDVAVAAARRLVDGGADVWIARHGEPVDDVVLLPLLLDGGALAVRGAVRPAVTEALRTLAAQVALALESAALTEDMHRQEHDERFRKLVQNASDVITVVDGDLIIRYQTPSARQVLGFGPDELVGTNFLDLIHPADAPLVHAAVAGVVSDRAVPPTLECRVRRKDGGYLRTETIPAYGGGDELGCVLTTRDITERKALEQQLKHQAFHDSVTGLANRALFVDRTHHALERRGLVDSPLAVLFLDLDDFKTVNDSLGHEAGDGLLAAVAQRLKACLRPSDTPARLGGDEFAVLLEELHDETEATRVAERALAALAEPFSVAGRQLTVAASVGIALLDPDSAPRAEDLLRDAEAAMYTAKNTGKGGYACFAPSMHEALVRKLEFTGELRSALEHGEFVLHYQPIVDLADGRITGVEALVRWAHPVRGMVSPLDFIPVAETTGLIIPLGRWVLREACRQAASWQRQTGVLLDMNVNVSVRQVQEPNFVTEVCAALKESGLPAAALCLEITETFLADDEGEAARLLCDLKGLGIRLAIDDFGTGYSSLSRLQEYPLDILKIPKPFVDGMSKGAEHSALARVIADLADNLGLDVVAEGIEELAQWDQLRSLNCRFGQGYYFARPLEAEAVAPLLHDGACLVGPSAQWDHKESRMGA